MSQSVPHLDGYTADIDAYIATPAPDSTQIELMRTSCLWCNDLGLQTPDGSGSGWLGLLGTRIFKSFSMKQ